MVDFGWRGAQGVVERVRTFVDEHYAEQISLRDVATVLGYNPAYLTHLFRRLTGTPVTAYIIKRRIRAAADMLSDPAADVADVGQAVGFNDVCYFTRQFVRHTGTTPARFRANPFRCFEEDVDSLLTATCA